MYTAKVIEKSDNNGVLVIGVEFSNGVDTRVENISPQDKTAFERWVAARLASLNSLVTLDGEIAVNDVVDPVETPPVLTQAEIDAKDWQSKYQKWVTVKNNLIDTGVLTGSETKVVELLDEVKTGFKPEYLNNII